MPPNRPPLSYVPSPHRHSHRGRHLHPILRRLPLHPARDRRRQPRRLDPTLPRALSDPYGDGVRPRAALSLSGPLLTRTPRPLSPRSARCSATSPVTGRPSTSPQSRPSLRIDGRSWRGSSTRWESLPKPKDGDLVPRCWPPASRRLHARGTRHSWRPPVRGTWRSMSASASRSQPRSCSPTVAPARGACAGIRVRTQGPAT